MNEENGAINLITANGIKEFAETGQTVETKQLGIKFDDEIILAELKYVKERLGATKKGQQYYIIRPEKNRSSFYFGGFDGDFIFASDVVNHTLLGGQVLRQKEMATALCHYVIEKLIPDTQREKSNSPLFTDKRASDYLESLIREVEERDKLVI